VLLLLGGKAVRRSLLCSSTSSSTASHNHSTRTCNICPPPPTLSVALSERRKALDAIKDSVELLHTAQYPGFLALCFDPVCAQLTATQPQFERESELQLLRHAALEVLSRLPANEAFKPHATRLCDICLSVIRADNQKNAVMGVKVFLDLHKSFRASFEPQFMAFVEFVGQVGG